MLDPALRRLPYPESGETKKEVKKQLREYKKSSVRLPKIWARTTLLSPRHPSVTSRKSLKEHHETFPYFPFCDILYQIATGKKKCYWRHIVLYCNTHLTYNFPCGCSNPHIENIYFSEGCIFPAHFKLTSAALAHPPSPYRSTDTIYEVPFSQAFRESANPLKRKKKGLSLTDNKTYRRKLRAKYSAAACSSSLRNLAEDESDQE